MCYFRLESRTGPAAYNKASLHLLAFKKAVIEEAKKLVDAEQYKTTIEYVLLAWNHVKATPIWDNRSHNKNRNECFKALAACCLTTLKSGNFTTQYHLELKSK